MYIWKAVCYTWGARERALSPPAPRRDSLQRCLRASMWSWERQCFTCRGSVRGRGRRRGGAGVIRTRRNRVEVPASAPCCSWRSVLRWGSPLRCPRAPSPCSWSSCAPAAASSTTAAACRSRSRSGSRTNVVLNEHSRFRFRNSMLWKKKLEFNLL